MAQSGSDSAKEKLGDSVKESDYFYDVPCYPCGKDGRNVEAIKYCTDCNENLCSTCLTHHNRFAMTRGHKVSDQVQTSQGQTKQLPSQRCSKHGGKVIDVFCPEHDAVGCATCISIDHSSCKGKKFIPDVAVGIKTSTELKQLETEMKSLKAKLESLKKLKVDNLQRLRHDKDALKKQIQSVRKKMNEQLDKMEEALVEETDTKFKQKIYAIHTSISEVDDMLAKVKHAMDQVKSDNNDADIFVSCKIEKQKLSKAIHSLHDEEHLLERSFNLHTCENTKLIMEGKCMFASLKEKYTIQEAKNQEDINIRTSDDEHICRISNMCALPDGCLVMADVKNKTLKKLDTVSHNVSTLINLPGYPQGLCLVDNTRLAVSLHFQKKIQFVSISGQVTLGTNFSVGDRCRDLAHCDGLLYVCCGGSRAPERIEGRGHVEVYNCTGELLRCLFETLDLPVFIAVINDGYNTTMFTSDNYTGVHVRGIDGAVKRRFPTVLNTDLPFCLVGTDQICTGEYSTGNIYIQSNENKRILVEKRDLNGYPVCVYFDKISSRLLVALYNCDVMSSKYLI